MQLALEAVPLHGRHAETVGPDVSRKRLEARLHVLCDAYGVPDGTVRQHLPCYLETIIGDVRRLAATGAEPFGSFARGRMIETMHVS